MEKTTLKKADLTVTRIGLGTNSVGGHNLFENLNEDDGREYVREGIKQGVTFIDTADVYGLGRSEEIIGEVLKDFNRDELIIATKGAQNFTDLDNFRTDNRPEYLRYALEQSLERLQLDYVDLYYLHFYDNETPFADSIGELVRMKEEGKIRSIGISNVTLEQLKEANVNGDIDVIQAPYNMLDRSVEEDILPYAIENNISFIPYGPLAFGLLGGNFTKDTQLDENDWRQTVNLFQEDQYALNIDKVEKLKAFTENKGVPLAHLALAWLLHQEGIAAVIPGGKRKERIISNIQAGEVKLSESELEEIATILK